MTALPDPATPTTFDTASHRAIEAWLKGQLCCFLAGAATGGLTLLLSGDWVQKYGSRPTWLAGNPGLAISVGTLAVAPAFVAAFVVDRHPPRIWILRRIAATLAGVAHFVLAWLMSVECVKSTANGASTLASIHGDLHTLRPSPIGLFIAAVIVAIGASVLLRGRSIDDVEPQLTRRDSAGDWVARSITLMLWSFMVPLACILLFNASNDTRSLLPAARNGNINRIYVLLEGVTTDKADLSEGSPVRLDGEQIGTVTQVSKSSGWRKQIRELELTLSPGHALPRQRFDSQTIAIVQSKPFLFGSDYVELLAGQTLSSSGDRVNANNSIAAADADVLPIEPVIAGIVAPSSTEAQLTQQIGKVMSQSEGAISALTKTAGEAQNTASAATSALQEAQKRLVESKDVMASVKKLADGSDDRFDRIELQLKVRLQELTDMLYEKLGGRAPNRSAPSTTDSAKH